MAQGSRISLVKKSVDSQNSPGSAGSKPNIRKCIVHTQFFFFLKLILSHPMQVIQCCLFVFVKFVSFMFFTNWQCIFLYSMHLFLIGVSVCHRLIVQMSCEVCVNLIILVLI